MSAYRPDIAESLFVLKEGLGWDRLFQLPAFAHADAETGVAVLEEGARFAAEVLAPLNVVNDEEGSRLVDGSVVTPTGFPAAWRAFTEGGWPALDLPLDMNGQGLPLALQAAFAEFVNGACVSFGMLPIMLRAGAWMVSGHGGADLAARVVPRLAAGEWAATICISEPSAGSDVGRIRTRAVPAGDAYRLTGTKIFITWGDHDFTDQICHFVLARTPDAPAGTRGLSLFLVPKLRFSDGGRNAARVSRVGKKMGLKASPTCVLDLDDAEGWRIGPEFEGLKCMFTMVNLMRLEVAVQGVALAGAATRAALRYASERRQGGAPDAPPVLIAEHADVRRMLMAMVARTNAMRALVLEAAMQLDLARAEEGAAAREARLLAEFLLPVCKACGSETGFEVANLCVQVFGGHGYVADQGVEQYVRDSRVMSIYEGTSGIQALDLVTRKVLRADGERYRIFSERVAAELARDDTPAELRAAVAAAHGALERCRAHLGKAGPRDVEAAATDFLQLAGLVAGGWMWLRMARACRDGSLAARRRLAFADFYGRWLLPQASVHESRVLGGAACLDALSTGDLVSLSD